ncbi:Sec-independent protein translocase protein TatB [Malaciobacter mytili]|uniref:Sec-independent protein translocase protein TatB homolog n=1 Tax=Malaciobacter mytili LMG 24559 TaxID=1032238 RepID=A0AAX2AG99_9BACT|nr:Sec-independent protein translocase protein TatB [Malaciobacter mytili]AXH15200.1 twin arginine translocation system, TatB protein [Malaciobacter mytili LMG 24559]RXI45415.1 twin-arginine translocase subunit TatB [Malaciobacter mytili]RXK15231.1 twin-arginine translocase subunit TatB [Malaciobacter mytili LMG 24559]
MFGMGFFEILLVAVIAIIALGPEKLPKAMVEIARFLKKFKSGIEDAKSTLDNELNISEMKEEANKFKAQIESAKSSVNVNNMDLGLDNILNDDLNKQTKAEKTENKQEKVSFKKETKVEEDLKEIQVEDASNKFKVKFDEDKKENN